MSNSCKSQELCLREKLLSNGTNSLSDQELLAVFISSGSQNRTCLDLAQALLNTFGDLRQIMNADLNTFQSIHGLGMVRYAQLMALKEICRRCEYINLVKGQAIKNTKDSYVFLKRCLRDKKNEVFSAIFLDNHLRALAYEELFNGTINASSIHIRPIIEKVLALNASAIILAHNHPSGNPKPSDEDRQVTKQLKKSLALIDARLLDHLVVGDNAIYSILNDTEYPCF